MFIEKSRGCDMLNTRHKILFNQLREYRKELINIADTVSDEEAEIIPKGFRNNIRWNLGHVYLDQYLWIKALTKEEMSFLEPLQKYFCFGTSPADFDENTPTIKEIKDLLKKQPDQIEEAYAHKLEEEFAPTEMGMHTIEQVLIRTIFHEGMHLQAIMDIKKCLKA
jgi:uncharacterized damage-inducible protein DinB